MDIRVILILNISDIKSIGATEFTQECRDQFNTFFGNQPELLVKEYCSSVQTKVIILLVCVGLMWLFEPVLKKWLAKQDNLASFDRTILFAYKWLGLGLLFIAGYSMMVVG